MHPFRHHHFPQFFGHVKTINRNHKDILYALSAHGLEAILGSLTVVLMPVLLTGIWQSEQKAGMLIMLLTGAQVFLFNPLAGALSDQKGALKVMKWGVVLEFLAILSWLFMSSGLGLYLFFLGVLARKTFFMSEALMLSRITKKEGGFWFGLREEILALSNLLGVFLLPWFLIMGHLEFIPFLMACVNITSLFLLWQVSRDTEQKNKNSWKQVLGYFNYWKFIKSGLRFVHKNHQYPLFNIGTNIFEGLFYGSIWFLLPLHLMNTVGNNSLSLGIYEVVTIISAFVCGILADRIDWRKQELWAWGLTLVLVWVLPFWHHYEMLVFIGFFIGLANNFFVAAGYHVLALFDEDHEEDGRYTAFADILKRIGYMFSPAICGYLYQVHGLQSALIFVAVLVSFVAVWMIYLVHVLGKNRV